MEEKYFEFLKEKPIVLIGIIIVFIGLVGIYFVYNEISNTNDIYEIENIVEENNVNEEKIKVYITGEVNNPGVIEIIEGDRIEDAISKAGGTTENASLDKVNLAYKLEDGQKIYIPSKTEEDIEVVSTENGQNVISLTSKNAKININSANVDKLCEIPGVGEALAKRIIDYRTENGKFKSIEDLKNVSGIGDKKFESIKNSIEVK